MEPGKKTQALLKSESTLTCCNRFLGTASSLLTTLNNPLNVTLLTSQLLSAPALWVRPAGLATCMQCMSVFHTAAQALVRHEIALRDKSIDKDFAQLQLERTLPKDDWIHAVLKGADHQSTRWQHVLALGGLLIGFGAAQDENLSRKMRSTLETALITAVNLSLEESSDKVELGQQSITMVLNHCFPLISDLERSQISYSNLLPVLMRSTFQSEEGLRSGYFLGAVDLDVQPASRTQFQWTARSASFQQIEHILSSPLMSSLGPLSRLIGHSIEHAESSLEVRHAMNVLDLFTKTMHLQWRRAKLSEIDPSEESTYLDREAHEKTTPQLWRLLRSTLFAVVIVLRSAFGRVLGDGALARDEVAPTLATQGLQILRNLYFISSRNGSSTFSQYTFVKLTAMDVLATYPTQAAMFLREIRPSDNSKIPEHPLDRCLDLFFLNTAEHFTLVLPPEINEDLLVTSALPYLTAGGNNTLLPIFEAAHSVMLAVFSAPQNADLTAAQLPFYIDALFKVFPRNLTARQFRLAFRTLLRLTSPPAALAVAQPMLSAALLELLHHRATTASTLPLFPQPLDPSQATEFDPPIELSEQAVLIITIIDTFSQISLGLLDEWLPLAADMVNTIDNVIMREYCKEQFWRVLVDGDMDPDRSGVCHAWWSTEGGREMLLYGRPVDVVEADAHLSMSGGLPDESKDSKL